MNTSTALLVRNRFGPAVLRRQVRDLLPDLQVAAVAILVFGTIAAIWLTSDGWDRGDKPEPGINSVVATPETTPGGTPASVSTPLIEGEIDAPIVWQTGSEIGVGEIGGNLVVDSSGNTYWGDCRNNRIAVIDPDGVFVEFWGEPSSGSGQFNFIFGDVCFGLGLGIDSVGNIYVFDTYTAECKSSTRIALSSRNRDPTATKTVSSINQREVSMRRSIG